ncbi:cysteine-rich RLK (RECEPTOR-like protein kinase) 26 [Euphorbia peplus]|nr:cysteine-rich RLK (RECEPTOR-like protein kinase) 26 [Euphorbia peplus]
MKFSKFILSPSILLLYFAILITAQPEFLHQSCFNDRGNYTANSIYKTNLDTVLSSLNSDTEGGGFYNLSIGQAPDRVEVKAFCRGDVGEEVCKGCIRNSTIKVLEICPNQKDAYGAYDLCSLRYSNRSIFGVEETEPTLSLVNTVNASNVNEFTRAQQTLSSRLRGLTAGGGSTLKFAVGSEGAGFETVYGLMQCSPDLSGQQCDDCLGQAIGGIADCCAGRKGGVVNKPSCQVRFEDQLFYQLTPSGTPLPPATSPPPPPTEGKDSNTAKTVVIIVVPTVCVVILAMFIYLCLRRRKPKAKAKADSVDDIEAAESLQLDFDMISVATNNFSDENKLGQGGFGAVYKGTLPNGQDIAVKRLSKNSGQGDLEFKNEVILVAKLQHRNLVRLLGFCLEGTERLLIYEFVANTSLDHFIFDPIKRKNLDWNKRYKIICGIARGLLYLHEDSRLRIIHRDMKASNILLDEEMNPKIADFGMARLFVVDQTQGNTSRIVGTYGYMAPEYAMHGHFSVKTDVFSFGVLLLEILSGQKNSSFRHGENIEDLLSFAWRSWREGTTMNLIDPNLKDSSSAEMMRCIHIALLCVQENVANRPTMNSILLMLNSFSLTLPVPSQPAFLMHTITESDMSYSSSQITESTRSRDEILPILSINAASITDLDPR